MPLARDHARAGATGPLEGPLGEAAGMGGDTDTIAAIAGQVAGAGLAGASLPVDLLRTLPDIGEVERTVGAFADVVSHVSR